MKVGRGDVVLIDYLFSDRSGSKVRPCLVVQNDLNNRRLNHTIVAAISSNVSRAASQPSQLIIRVGTTEGKQSGLLFDSVVQCENLATIDAQYILRKIGALLAGTMLQVDECLKVSLGLNPSGPP